MADPATTRLANTVGYVYEDNDSYTRFEDEEGRDMVTDAYDASKTYAEGALCINDNKLYKAASAIETAEVWTPDHWTQTDINTELSSLNTKTTNLQTDLSALNNVVTNARVNAIYSEGYVKSSQTTLSSLVSIPDLQWTSQERGIVVLRWHIGVKNTSKEATNIYWISPEFYRQGNFSWDGSVFSDREETITIVQFVEANKTYTIKLKASNSSTYLIGNNYSLCSYGAVLFTWG